MYIGGRDTVAAGTGTLDVLSGGSVTNTGLLHVWNTGTVTINAGTLTTGRLGLSGQPSGTIALTDPTGLHALTINGSGTGDFSGVISGSGSVQKSGAGTQTFSGSSSNTYTGTTIITGGTLQLSKTAGVNAFGGDVTISGGTLTSLANHQIPDSAIVTVNSGTFNLNSRTETVGGLAGSGGTVDLGAGAFTVSQSSNSSYSGVITGSGSFTKAGIGALTLSGVNTYTGATTISGGTLQFANQLSLYNNNTSNWTQPKLIINSGTTLAISVGGSGEFTTGNVTTLLTNLGGLGTPVTTGGFLAGSRIGFDTTGGNFTVADNIADSTGSGGGAIGLIKLGANTLTLSGTNTYTGATTINGGTVAFSALNNFGTGTAINFNGGTLQFGASVDISTRTVTINSGGATFDTNGNNVSFANAIGNSGGGGLTKTGAGTLTLSAANTYTGATNINGGTVAFSALNNLGAGTAINFNGGTLQFGATVGVDISTRTVTINSGGATIDTNFFNIDLANPIGNNGSGGLTKLGTTTLTLIGNNTYTGATTISVGTLQIGNGGTTGSVAGNILNNNVLVFNRSDTPTYGGVISGFGNVSQNGSGSLTLTGNNSYSGNTQVSTGSLFINGNQSTAVGPVYVSSTATLGGTGTVGSSLITVNNGGTVRGGDNTSTTGTLTTNSISVYSGAAIAVNIGASGVNSQLAVGSNTLNLSVGGPSTLKLTSIAGFDHLNAGTYTIASLSGGTFQLNNVNQSAGNVGTYIQGTGASGAVTIDASSVAGLVAGNQFSLDFNGTNLVLVYSPVPVPEPAAILGIAVGALGLGRIVRRRLRKPSETTLAA